MTGDLRKRIRNHARKPWWPAGARVVVEVFPDRAAVLEAERAAIAAEHPEVNVALRVMVATAEAHAAAYGDDMRRLGAELSGLADRGDPAEIMSVLGALTSNASGEEALLVRLRTMRRGAAGLAAAEAGGKRALAQRLGISEISVYRALNDGHRVRKPPRPREALPDA